MLPEPVCALTSPAAAGLLGEDVAGASVYAEPSLQAGSVNGAGPGGKLGVVADAINSNVSGTGAGLRNESAGAWIS